MKVGSFKKYLDDIKQAPYHFLISNTEEAKSEEEKVDDKSETKEEKDAEKAKSLLQYLMYAAAKN